MAAILWVWFLSVAVPAVFAGALWATIISELLKEHRRKCARAPLIVPLAGQPQLVISGHGPKAWHRWRGSLKVSTAASPRSGRRPGDVSDGLATHEIPRSPRPRGVPVEPPNRPATVHPLRLSRSTRLRTPGSGRQCRSRFANPRKP